MEIAQYICIINYEQKKQQHEKRKRNHQQRNRKSKKP